MNVCRNVRDARILLMFPQNAGHLPSLELMPVEKILAHQETQDQTCINSISNSLDSSAL